MSNPGELPEQTNQLRKNSLGVAAVTFLVVSAAAPLTAVAGGVPLSMLLGNGPGIPLTFLSGTPAIGILFCFAAFIGFEATTIYSEEARDPGRTVPRATYISVLIIGIFYMLTAWLMVNGAGAGKLVGELQALQDPTTFLFGLAERYVGHWIIPVMNLLFVTSLFAGVVAFHNGVARYMYVAGREGLLPRGLGVTHPQYQSPHVGSIVQTAIAITVVGIFAVTGQDPVLALFSWATNVGTLAIMLLMTFTAFAIIAFFARRPGLESNPFTTRVLPLVTGTILGLLVIYIAVNFGSLAGANGFMAVFLPGLVLVAAIAGLLLALRLKGTNAAGFARLGAGQAV
ncbi:amino acid permease [Brucella sp. BO3]|uniref:APC family permease n=1 Tax=unclassified Brucella TaxID=2632610 RepID=UPI00084F8A4C|nr:MULTISPECIES: APC family permease [unclassified Brucella]OEI83001.1 hypothetical protein BA060_07950 [Brucella sp. B13-0095]QMV27655.1 amino acid permease [Brucella sp. BO3]